MTDTETQIQTERPENKGMCVSGLWDGATCHEAVTHQSDRGRGQAVLAQA